MRKVIGIGETILDIIFREGRPYIAMPGGSVFNTLVSLSRVGVQTWGGASSPSWRKTAWRRTM